MPRPKMTEEERRQRARESRAKWRAKNPDYDAEYMRKNAAKAVERARAWVKANPERRKAWEEKNRERMQQYHAEYWPQYYAKNSERHKQRARDWSAKNSDRKRMTDARWRDANKQRLALGNKRWRASNADRRRIYEQNRRARKKVGSGKLSANLLQVLMKLQRGKCACCRAVLKRSSFHLDHIEPLARGGRHHDRNMQLLCPPCNLQKNAKDPLRFMQERGFLL